MEPALVSVTVRVSDSPAVMLLELAVMETVGTEAAALVANSENAQNTTNKDKNFCTASRL
jgi:hypothetical protein